MSAQSCGSPSGCPCPFLSESRPFPALCRRKSRAGCPFQLQMSPGSPSHSWQLRKGHLTAIPSGRGFHTQEPSQNDALSVAAAQTCGPGAGPAPAGWPGDNAIPVTKEMTCVYKGGDKGCLSEPCNGGPGTDWRSLGGGRRSRPRKPSSLRTISPGAAGQGHPWAKRQNSRLKKRAGGQAVPDCSTEAAFGEAVLSRHVPHPERASPNKDNLKRSGPESRAAQPGVHALLCAGTGAGLCV